MKKDTIGLILTGLGIFDTLFLLDETYNQSGICGTGTGNFLGTQIDCGYVLTSEYSKLLGMPLALWGFIFYTTMFILFFTFSGTRKYQVETLLLGSITGFIASSIFVYLQFAVLQLVCLYCMGSALTSILLFILMTSLYKELKT